MSTVTRTGITVVTYCVSEPDNNAPDDRSRDFREFYQVSFKGSEVTEIKMAHSEINYLPARTLWQLKQLFAKLESEGYQLSYKPIQVKVK